MARIRCIKPEFPQSESMGRVSRDARLLFVLLWTVADDSGKARGNSRMLASLLYPYDDDAPKHIEKWLAELEREDCVERYEVEGNAYLRIRNWLTHQKIDKPTPSKLPDPREDSRAAREDSRILPVGSGSGSGSGIGSKPSAPSPDGLKAESGEDPIRKANGHEADHTPVVESIPLVDGSDYPVTARVVDELDRAYPAVDVTQTLREIRAWCLTNPQRRKTRAGALRFINGWLSREQNRAPGRH